MNPNHPDDVKRFARGLRAALAPHLSLNHGQTLDLIARADGFADWNVLSASLRRPVAGSPMPILRVHEASRALPFYVDWLGFEMEFEHRFAADLPVFAAVRMGDTVLGLSEHHGDGTPGSVVWLPVRGLEDYRDRLVRNDAVAQRPGIDRDAPGGPTMTVIDPFGNQLRFCEPVD